MRSKTPKKTKQGSSDPRWSPKSPGWVSGRDAVFISPKSLSPKKPNTRRRTSVYQKKSISPSLKLPITQMISPKGVQTRSRRSSMFGVYRKGGIRLIDIPITPDVKRTSPKTRTRRSSVYQKESTKDTQLRTNRRTSLYHGTKDFPPKSKPVKLNTKPSAAPFKPTTRKTRIPVSNVKLDKSIQKSDIQLPVLNLEDIASPYKQIISPNKKYVILSPTEKSKSNIVLQTPSIVNKPQGKRHSMSESQICKTPGNISPTLNETTAVRSVIKSLRKSSKKTPARQHTPKESKQEIKDPERKAKKTALNETDESLLITFKTPAVSVKRSTRKRKPEENVSPPAKKCLLDLSPVEKLPFKTPHKLDKSPILVLTRTPLSDVFTSTPIESNLTTRTPLMRASGRKSLKQNRKTSLKSTKRVAIVSDLKTPDSNRSSLISKRKGTPAKSVLGNYDESPKVNAFGDSKNIAEPYNITILNDKNTSDQISVGNTTSHSSAGRCTIL